MFGSPTIFNLVGSNTQKIGSAAPKQGRSWPGKAKIVNICGLLGTAETPFPDLSKADRRSIWSGDGVHLTASRVAATTLLVQRWNSWTQVCQFDKRLQSFTPCHSQSLLLADFKENHTLL